MKTRSGACAIDVKEGRVPDIEDNAKRCACPMCPTFNECMKGKEERLYCARGKSRCPFDRLGCVCGECEVALDHGLSSNYYCANGVAKF